MGLPNLKMEHVLAAMRIARGSSVRLVPLSPGEESRAYLLFEDSREYILRVNRSKFGFEKDTFAYEHFHSASLPIPAVIAIGDLHSTHFFCITERIAGTTLQDLSEEEVRDTLQPTAKVMQHIRECDISMTRGFGPLDQHGIGSHSSWRDFLRSPVREEWAEISNLVCSATIQSALEKLLSLSEDAEDFRNLVHGDFGSNNVLSDGRSITGVIDWSEAMIGDPLYDVANIFFWRTWLNCMDLLASFLEDALVLDLSARRRLLCYQLHIGLREVYESAIREDRSATAWRVARMEDFLRQLN